MKNKTKWVTWGFFSLDYKAVETYLEEMAEKGWMLEKVGRFMAKFRAIEPRKLKFYVDVFKKGGPLTPENTAESEEYRKLCRESGWVFITSQDYLQFFYADRDSDPVPIQTDAEIEQKIVELTLFKNELRGIFLFFIIATFVLSRSFPVRHTRLLSFTGITGTFLFPLLCILTAVPAIYGVTWMLKAKKSIKNGMPIEKPALKSARRRIIAFHGSTLIIILIYALSFTADAFFMPDRILLALSGPVAGTIIGLGIRHVIKKNKVKEDNSILFMVIAVIAAFLFISKISSVITEWSADIYKVDSIPDRYPAVTMEEILEGSETGVLSRREFKAGMSPVVPMHYDYWETRDINYIPKHIDIKYYNAINSYFAEIIFNGITNALEKGFKWKGMTLFEKTIITDDEMKSLWNADNLALTGERDEIIVRKGNIVLHLSGDMDFNEKQTRKLMIERFFPDS